MKGQILIDVPLYVANNIENIADANGFHISNVIKFLIKEIKFPHNIPKISFNNDKGVRYLSVKLNERLAWEERARKRNTTVRNMIRYAIFKKGLIKEDDVKAKVCSKSK